MYKFGQISIASKDFNRVYQVTDINAIDLEKLRISDGAAANKHDTRYTIGYEIEPGKIIALNIKTPKDCVSSGVTRYNESSPWKMGFNVSDDENWVKRYTALCEKIEELLFEKMVGEPIRNGQYINAKLITWDSEIRTRFRGISWNKPEDIGACFATGILKIGSVYKQGSNYYLQVFLKECKYKERDIGFKSQLSGDEDDYDTVF